MPRTLPKPRTSDVASPVLETARQVLAGEAAAIGAVAERLGPSFERAVQLLLECRGRVVVTGMGKAGIIGQKLSATLASTGTPSHFLHPAEALHGDLGRVVRGDVVVAISNSGETDEVIELLASFRRLGTPLVALTGQACSTLGRSADAVLDVGPVAEPGRLGLAPTASTAALLALGDALAMCVLEQRTFSRDDYAFNHPGGKLGAGLRKVGEVMRKGPQNPVVRDESPLSEAIAMMTCTPGRPGCTNVTDGLGRLVGIFTDGDLRRLVEAGPIDFGRPVGDVMTRGPQTVRPDLLARDAAQVLRERQIDQVPVVDEHHRPIGLLDVQDLLAARLLET